MVQSLVRVRSGRERHFPHIGGWIYLSSPRNRKSNISFFWAVFGHNRPGICVFTGIAEMVGASLREEMESTPVIFYLCSTPATHWFCNQLTINYQDGCLGI